MAKVKVKRYIGAAPQTITINKGIIEPDLARKVSNRPLSMPGTNKPQRKLRSNVKLYDYETQFSSDGVWVLGLYESLYSTFKQSY